jgi:hypothetical protein
MIIREAHTTIDILKDLLLEVDDSLGHCVVGQDIRVGHAYAREQERNR